MSNLENNMLFPVKEVPAILQDSHLSTEHKFIVREDTEQVLSCMSNEYKLVTNNLIGINLYKIRYYFCKGKILWNLILYTQSNFLI